MEAGNDNLNVNKSRKSILFIAVIALILGLASILIYSYRLEQYAATLECDELKMRIAFLESEKVRLNNPDWANLEFYREANKKLAAPLENEQRVIFIGDSITARWSAPGYGGFFPDKPYINRGISGQITLQMLIRFRQDVISLRPKVVVILAGTNDIGLSEKPDVLDTIKDNLVSMTELARANGIKVVLASVLPVNDYEKESGTDKFFVQTASRPPEKIKSLNNWIKEYAHNNKFVFLDYYSLLSDESGFLKEGLSMDGLHPNAEGYAIMAPLAEQAINLALKQD